MTHPLTKHRPGVTKSTSVGKFASTCPHCGAKTLFKPSYATEIGGAIRLAVAQCQNGECLGMVVAIFGSTAGSNPESDLIRMWPGRRLPIDLTDVPEKLAAHLSEAATCHAEGCYTAAAIMLRRVVEELCEDAGAQGKTLHDRLKDVKAQQKLILTDELFDVLFELKALGNDAAHVDLQSFDNVGESEATVALRVAMKVVEALFQQKSIVEELRSLKRRSNI